MSAEDTYYGNDESKKFGNSESGNSSSRQSMPLSFGGTKKHYSKLIQPALVEESYSTTLAAKLADSTSMRKSNLLT